MVYRAVNGLAPGYMRSMFCCVPEVYSRSTQATVDGGSLCASGLHEDLQEQYCAAHRGAQIWNMVSAHTRQAVPDCAGLQMCLCKLYLRAVTTAKF